MAYRTYKSFKELNGKTLQYGDTIYFGKLKYEVSECYLHLRTGANDEVFTKMKIDEGAMEELIERAYGYPTRGGNWPECKSRDYEALTRAALMVYALMDNDPYIEFQFGKTFRTIDLATRTKQYVVKLNDQYSAFLGHKSIRVGCQRISYDVLGSLVRAAHKAGKIKLDTVK